MTLARLYIDGEPWEIMGNVADSFLKYTNTLNASRGGRIYAATESRVPTVTVDDVMAENDEFGAIESFLNECSGRRFNATVEFSRDCGVDSLSGREFHYIGCMIQGEPEYSMAERKITGFEFGYSDRIER